MANQVKRLAGQTSVSADDIGEIIQSIQGRVAEAVASVEAIAGSAVEVSDMTSTVAAAVEEQTVLMSQLEAAANELFHISADERKRAAQSPSRKRRTMAMISSSKVGLGS